MEIFRILSKLYVTVFSMPCCAVSPRQPPLPFNVTLSDFLYPSLCSARDGEITQSFFDMTGAI